MVYSEYCLCTLLRFTVSTGMSNLSDYITVRDAAKKLKISISSVYVRINKGKLRAVKHGGNHFIHKDQLVDQ